ncbi:MAG: hypothetical protein ACOZDY_15720 [Pseudomonadota bacterium]
MAKKGSWHAFPHPDDDYAYEGAALKKHWARLHQGDLEPFPDAARVEELLDASPPARKSAGKAGADPKALAASLVQAWSLFHRSDFGAAAALGWSLGFVGYPVASKATGIYATYLEPDTKKRLQLLKDAADQAEKAREALPDDANAQYFHAFLLGRYGQGLSVMEALSKGLGGKIREGLDAALELAPGHAEALVASATWHAEIVAKVGGMVARLTYGASKDRALDHYKQALKAAPKSPIVPVEYAAGLRLLGADKSGAARRLLAQAAKMKPADAMEKLDVELAKARLAGL